MKNISSLILLETSNHINTPFDPEFSYTQIPCYDTSFKESSFLLEKAENIRCSLASPLKALISSAECENLLESIECWVLAISANCKGRISESGLKFETQNPYIKIESIPSNSECILFYEHLKIFLRVVFEMRNSLEEITLNLNVLGQRMGNFCNSIKIEAEKLDLNSFSSSIIRRNIDQNLIKLSFNLKKIRHFDQILKKFEFDKNRFFKLCNSFIENADEIGLRGWYEKRLCPRHFRELLNPDLMQIESEDVGSKLSEKIEMNYNFISDSATSDAINEESKFNENNNIPDFDSEENNNNLFVQTLSFSLKEEVTKVSNSKNEATYPMMIPFNCLNLKQEGVINEGVIFNKKVVVKILKIEENQILDLLTEINTLNSLGNNFARCLGFSISKNPLYFYLFYEAFHPSLYDLIIKKKKDFSFIEKIDICIEILKMIDLLNKNDLVHGNLNLKTIKMNSSYQPIISEYGASKYLNRTEIKNFSIEFLMHDKYLKNHDIYNFGIIMYEIFSEKEAWFNLKDEEILIEKKKLLFFNKNIRFQKEIDDLIEKCVDCEEQERMKPSELILVLSKLKNNKC